MFLSIYHNASGQDFVRQVAPNENTSREGLRDLVRRWANREYDGYEIKISFSEPGAHIFNGCAEYQAELRDTKAPSASCWASEPFYVEFIGE